MNFFKIKGNEDFIFKIVLSFSFFLILFIIFSYIYFFYNCCDYIYEYIFDNIEGMSSNNKDEDDQVNEDDQANEDNQDNEDNEANEDNEDDQNNEFYDSKGDLIPNEKKQKFIDTVNSIYSHNDGNRERAIERVNWFKNYNKSVILFNLSNSALTDIPIRSSEVLKRVKTNRMFESGKIDKIIESFPLNNTGYNNKENLNSSDTSDSFFI